MTSLSNQQANGIVAAEPVRSRRVSLLAGTAFAGGVFALILAVNPQTAAAACAVTSLPNTVDCATTTTTNTTNTNAGAAASTDRQQNFTNGGVVNPGVTGNTVNVGATVDGFGLAITSTTATDVNVNNAGIVTNTAGSDPAAGGTAAFNISSAGGNIVYTGSGATTSTCSDWSLRPVERAARPSALL